MPDRAVSFHLIIHGPRDYTAEFAIPIGITTFGRDPDNLLQLDDPTISRHHGRLECIAGECDITDFGSSNGTFVNGVRIQPRTPLPLNHQDQIRLGPYFELLFLREETVLAESLAGEPQDLVMEEEPASPGVIVLEEAPPPPPEGPHPPAPSPDGAGELLLPGLALESRRLLKYLPEIYHTDFMRRFLGIFESLLIPIEWTIDNFDLFLSPQTAPSTFLPWLANWYDAEFDNTWTETQRRGFLKEAWLLSARRGTKWALSRVLEIYLGQPAEIDDLADELRPHTFRVTIPVGEGRVNRDTIEALIRSYKPAHTDYEIHFRG
jgi:phage tail-like protein